MKLSDIFSPELSLYCSSGINSKKRVLEKISKLISTQDLEVKYQYILDSLQQRERLGDTGIGHGVAIPHARVEGISAAHCAVLSLKQEVNFSAKEGKPVDLIFGLIVPESYDETHLQLLSSLTQQLRHEAYRHSLRQATSDEALYQALITAYDES